jgi:hypothetical protein
MSPTFTFLTSLFLLSFLHNVFSKPFSVDNDPDWTKFKLEHNRFYDTSNTSEELYRYDVFKRNKALIDDLNTQNLTYTLSVNRFTDMTEDELTAKRTGLRPSKITANEMRTFLQDDALVREASVSFNVSSLPASYGLILIFLIFVLKITDILLNLYQQI